MLLLTAFSCMACDGEIAGEELSLIKELDAKEKLFGDIEVGVELKKLKEQIDKEGNQFLKRYIGELGKSELTKEQELDLLRVAYRTILADNKVEYSEVKFFKVIREFGIRSLCNKPAFVNDVNIQRRFLWQKVVRNESCNQV